MIKGPRHALLLLVALLPLLPGCSARPPATDYPRTETHAFEDTSSTRLGKAYAKAAAAHPGQSGFHIINSGPAALMTRVTLVEMAERSVDLQYFTADEDNTGKLLLATVMRAADRGVRVRMLVDAWDLDSFRAIATTLDAHPHIEVRLYNPYATRDESLLARVASSPSYLTTYDRRMHNKAFIVDNEVAVLGGRNLGDEYFDADAQLNMRDIDVFTAGPIVKPASQSFDRYWNSDESFPVAVLNLPPATPETTGQFHADLEQHWQEMMHSKEGANLKSIPLPQEVKRGKVPLLWADAEFAADRPSKTETAAEDAHSVPGHRIHELADAAQHEFILFSPYFVPLDKGTDWLGRLTARGVKVRVITNSLSSTDMVPAQAGYAKYRKELVDEGVQIFEIKSIPPKEPARRMIRPSAENGLHAKIYMVDRSDLVIGSFNLDPRSAKLNTEQALIIHSPEVCKKVIKLFEDLSSPENSYEVISASKVPQAKQPFASASGLAWKTEEDGEIKYFDLNPHTGFLRSITNDFFSLLPMDDEL